MLHWEEEEGGLKIGKESSLFWRLQFTPFCNFSNDANVQQAEEATRSLQLCVYPHLFTQQQRGTGAPCLLPAGPFTRGCSICIEWAWITFKKVIMIGNCVSLDKTDPGEEAQLAHCGCGRVVRTLACSYLQEARLKTNINVVYLSFTMFWKIKRKREEGEEKYKANGVEVKFQK